ncbi:AAA_33 domain-containing protein [Cephalotus follicularis]|uniref:AAA_33 domain-containing protein n=1 Tax=Cephalotus follicularis TaxID=3775 RepID=A0A1Q3C117_CEPFO|nr:AAA_33 domain-containing protein [Cephalotus follicularis]
MDHQWRPRPPQATICPICSYSHFPFCPPPPPHPPYNHYQPPLPDYPRPAFDPYPPTPPRYIPDPRPININPNINFQCTSNPMFDFYNNSNDYFSEQNRGHKRPRVDEFASNSARFLSDDERRLKLIRDHGAASYGPPPPPPPPPPPLHPPIDAEHNQKFRHNDSVDYWQAFSGSQQHQLPPLKKLSPEKPKAVDASHLFKQPHRATRPDHLVIILRGLPGSGKSYLAKMLRDLEVENGGDAPRIHSMDDYFMTEIEKVEESDVSKSSSLVRSKKPVVKMVMEYCYEPEMEEAYRSSMLKAFKKTLEEGIFTFIIVDDRNLRVADFAQFWATAKSLGYEVYMLEATYKDPAGCAARNVHGFTLDEIQKMAGLWEEAPPLYLQLDIKLLFHGDNLKESGIQEVDMDMGDGDLEEALHGNQGQPQKIVIPSLGDDAPDDPSKNGKRWEAEGDQPSEEVKALGRSKWSDDLDEDDTNNSKAARGNINALSGLIHAYRKEGKSVRWSDQVGSRGFSIGAAQKATMLSLVIGPGAGYNLKSNPLPEEQSLTSTSSTNKSGKQSVFQEQLRAEHESFKAVFDRRRQWVGVDLEEE